MQSAKTLPQVRKAAILFPAFSLLHAPDPISQTELALLLSLRGRLQQLQEDVAAEEAAIRARLEAGAHVEPGDHTAELRENFRRSVSWKAVVVRLATRLRMDGEAYCARVLASTKPTRKVSLEIR